MLLYKYVLLLNTDACKYLSELDAVNLILVCLGVYSNI